ncbi:MAG: glutamine--fructose-6-phosphate transaminase (isomerizing) [Pseudomonadales bacterium]|nr:glutamine--fructose-6-phosphate transaminase (isomerizing) [Pseudomonadales bacterium]
MCGIVGAVADRNVAMILLEGLQRLEYRGYDSAGMAVIPAGESRIDLRRKVGKVKELADDLRRKAVLGKVGIAHTRWATHGKPSERNAHPHLSGTRVALVHNGIIENHDELRTRLKQEGYEFLSETDTEVIAHLVHANLKRGLDLLDAVRETITELEGAYALAVMDVQEPGRIIAARQGSPLVVGIGIGENFVASDVLALKAVTDRFIYLEEGDLVEVTRESTRIWNRDNQPVERNTVRVEIGNDDLSKGNHRHHMMKEIHEQPDVLRRTLQGRIGKQRVLSEALGAQGQDLLKGIDAVTLVACGTSFYAASVARYWIEELTGMPCRVEIASEFRYRKVAVIPNSLFVTISQSGETADTLAALRVAKEIGFRSTLTICNVATSSLARESDVALMLHAGTEVGVASTKAFTAQLADLLLLALMLGRTRGMAASLETRVVKLLHGIDNVVEQTLRLDAKIQRWAEEIMDRHHALFLGRGPMYPVALEGALKLKEISYIHAEGYPAGELKHGPLALVDEDMPVIAVAPDDELLEKVQSNLQEVRARGGQLYVFTDSETSFKDEPGVKVMKVPHIDRLLAPIVFVVPLQLLAYHVAVLKGTDVDQPRNLAKSVTVE